MKLEALIAACATVLIVSSVAVAGSVTITISPDPVTVGQTFGAEVCGLGGRTADYRITDPNGSQVSSGQIYAPSCGTITQLAEVEGVYTVAILNKNGNKVVASASVTAVP